MATETTLTSTDAWSPDVTGYAAGDIIPDALVLQCSTVLGKIEGDEPLLRVAYIDDAAADFVAEGAVIPEADPSLSEVTVATGKVAQLVRLSREQYVNGQAAGKLSDSVRRAVTTRANQAFLSQAAPTAPAVTPPAGITNVTGITSGGAVAGSLDKLVDIVAGIETAGGTPSQVLLSPTAWASLCKFKTGTSSAQSLIGAGVEPAQRQLLGVPVVVTSALTGSNGLVIDRAAVVSAVGDVMIATSEEVFFASDSVAVRCTFRFGATVVKPARVAKFTVTAPS
ncbi:HK97 family phage major capsid protein [Branchiibius hedensis]|uniref:Phage major capsid protein, HK97 family n=1 Tax=Branchiibius hedensis TaxID=672460 RepID=A0A2Y8ZQ93_9MICO|nr:phage major capsid protein [Branchiibius hedensis]PWJ24739.1 HK97 family phage major capsid protein [Branchiibius hedensis]SSA33556.1 phage major capsid protein, HK97 family [Branchiibius hedensis]